MSNSKVPENKVIVLREISKAEAEEWLSHTAFNRKINKKAMLLMRSDMNHGKWNPVVCPPVFIDEKTGAVIDGQHRLQAFAGSTLDTFHTYVAEVPRKSIEVIDTGRSRSLVDILTIRGHDHAVAKSAWLNTGMEWAIGLKPSHILTRSDQVEIVEAAPYLDQAAKVANTLKQGRSRKVLHVPTGTVAALYDMQEYGLGGELVVEYVTRLQGNLELDPLMSRLQAKLMDAANPRSKATFSEAAKSYLIARVFNAWANDEDLSRMYARKQAVYELPGFSEWREANFASLI